MKTILTYSKTRANIYDILGTILNVLSFGLLINFIRGNLFFYKERTVLFNILDTKPEDWEIVASPTFRVHLYHKKLKDIACKDSPANISFYPQEKKFYLGYNAVDSSHAKDYQWFDKNQFSKEEKYKNLYNHIILTYTYYYIEHIIKKLREQQTRIDRMADGIDNMIEGLQTPPPPPRPQRPRSVRQGEYPKNILNNDDPY